MHTCIHQQDLEFDSPLRGIAAHEFKDAMAVVPHWLTAVGDDARTHHPVFKRDANCVSCVCVLCLCACECMRACARTHVSDQHTDINKHTKATYQQAHHRG